MSPERSVTFFGRDMTARWSCRQGDVVLWSRCTERFGAGRFSVLDLWELRAGEFVTITNRPADLPPWFTLHPTEVCNALAFEVEKRIQAGWEPGEVVDGPNIWRALAGDRLAWIGVRAPSQGPPDGVLALLEFADNALVLGDSICQQGLGEFVGFGALETAQDDPAAIRRAQAAIGAIQRLGLPREIAEEWRLG
jgi:hypothetical protein